MSLIENNKELHGFGESIRCLYVTVTDLKLSRGGSGIDPSDDEAGEPEISEMLTGNAAIDDDNLITVIGSDISPVNQLSFSLTPFDNRESHAKKWHESEIKWSWDNENRTADNEDQNRLLQYLKNVREVRYDDHPPTAFIGLFEGWYVECDVPKVIFDSLCKDFISGRCNTLQVGIDLHPAFVDNEYAEIFGDSYEPAIFGLLDYKKYGSTGSGWITFLNWTYDDKGILPAEIKPNHEEQKTLEQKLQEQIHALQQSITESTGNLASELKKLILILRIALISIVLLMILDLFL